MGESITKCRQARLSSLEAEGTPIDGCKHCTVLVLRMAHRIWKETKQLPGTAGPGNMLGSCLVLFPFPVGHPMSAGCTVLEKHQVKDARQRKEYQHRPTTRHAIQLYFPSYECRHNDSPLLSFFPFPFLPHSHSRLNLPMERRKERTRVARNSTEQTTERNGTAEQRGGAAQKSQLARMPPAMNKAPFHYHGRTGTQA